MRQSDRERLKQGLKRRAKKHSQEEAKEYYVGACKWLKAEGRMMADEYAEWLRVIGKRAQRTEQLELFV